MTLSSGSATAGSPSTLPPGAYTVVASYSGDSNNNASSGTTTLAVSEPPTTNLYSYSASSYDTSGNLLAYTDSVMGAWSFSYDQLNRLSAGGSSAGPYSGDAACWTYDSFGNRLTEAVSTTACDSSPTPTTWATYSAQNQVTGTTQAAGGYTYDNAGNVTNDGVNQYLYDAEGRVCAVYINLTEAGFGYMYDAAGNRVAKGTITGWSCDPAISNFVQTEAYVIGPDGQQLTEVDGSDNWVHTNVYAGGKQIGTYDSAGMHYYFDDPLGTRRAQANSSGTLEATYQSLPFGDGYVANTSDDPTENHFTAKERDSESGNDYFGARYYNSAVGRFLSPDWSASNDPVPYANLSDPQSLDLYVYVRNSPLYAVDSDGHDGCAVEGTPIDCSEVNSEAFTQCPDDQCTGASRDWESPSGGKYKGDDVLMSTQITQFTVGADGSQGVADLTSYSQYSPPNPASVAAQYANDVPIIASQLNLSEEDVRASISVKTNPDGSTVVIGGHVNMSVTPNSVVDNRLQALLGSNYNGGQGNEFARLGGLTPSVHLDQGLMHVDRFNAGAWGYLGVVPHALYDVLVGGQNGNNPMLPY